MRLGIQHKAPHGHNRHRLERFEGYTDIIVVGAIVLLGAAMVWGLITAGSGAPSWW
jgi:hypothetical protein